MGRAQARRARLARLVGAERERQCRSYSSGLCATLRDSDEQEMPAPGAEQPRQNAAPPCTRALSARTSDEAQPGAARCLYGSFLGPKAAHSEKRNAKKNEKLQLRIKMHKRANEIGSAAEADLDWLRRAAAPRRRARTFPISGT